MYRIQHNGQLALEDFYLPLEGRIDPENRWIVLSGLPPWKEMEEKYSR
jgi:hypothetical protein